MSFRGRLRLFFALIVIVPMVALAIVLVTITARSETGKADAGIAAGVRTAFAIYREQAERAVPALREVASDRALRSAIVEGRDADAEARMSRLVQGEVVSIELWSPSGPLVARAGSLRGTAPKGAPLSEAGGDELGELLVSVTEARELVRRIRELSGHEVAVFRDR